MTPAYTRSGILPPAKAAPSLSWALACFLKVTSIVLIGTAALLGEGWDAPAMNSLVMATVIGSYVSSNQIRGRAIRVDPQDPFKTATIWHLACVHSGEEIRRNRSDGGSTGSRGAKQTTGPCWNVDSGHSSGCDMTKPAIENGIERLGIGTPIAGSAIASLNAQTCREACKRDRLAEAWRSAIFNPAATHSRVVHEVFVPVPRIPSSPGVAALVARQRRLVRLAARLDARTQGVAHRAGIARIAPGHRALGQGAQGHRFDRQGKIFAFDWQVSVVAKSRFLSAHCARSSIHCSHHDICWSRRMKNLRCRA